MFGREKAVSKIACCFTGHRPQNLPFGTNEQLSACVRLKEVLRGEIERQITENGVSHFITGMALGVDMIAAQCDKDTMLQCGYTKDCFLKRNQYMVDNSDFVIAVWNGSPSGTGQTVTYARAKNKTITIINPFSMEISK